MKPDQIRRDHFTIYAETLEKRFHTGILATCRTNLSGYCGNQRDEQGNIHKRPFTPKGYPASIYKPRQWASLDNALEGLTTGNFVGIGLMLSAPFVLLDKDAAPDCK